MTDNSKIKTDIVELPDTLFGVGSATSAGQAAERMPPDPRADIRGRRAAFRNGRQPLRMGEMTYS